MSVSFDGIKVGDRVRLFDAESQDEKTFTVASMHDGALHDRTDDCITDDEWTYVEVLKPLPKPLPTEDGVYIPKGTGLDQGPLVLTLWRGKWFVNLGGNDGAQLAQHWHEETGLSRLVVES